jgi:poly-gamma-glutamate synthesis protein (capsule biosynthesis protein)
MKRTTYTFLFIYLFLVIIVAYFSRAQTTRLSFCGDIMLSRHIGSAIEKYGPEHVFSECKYIYDGSSVIFGNLESIISNDPFLYKDGMRFKAGEKALFGLKFARFNYLNVMNNHRYDHGEPAWNASNGLLRENGIVPVTSSTLEIFEKNGTKIGLIAFDMTARGFNRKVALEKVATSSAAVDILVVSVHWGEEYQNEHNFHQGTAAHEFVDAGADLIIGHHPHSLQDIEKYKGAYIFYSLGNFIFDQYFREELTRGLVVSVDVKGRWINSIKLFPTKMYDDKVMPAEPRIRDAVLFSLAEHSSPALIDQIVDGRLSN